MRRDCETGNDLSSETGRSVVPLVLGVASVLLAALGCHEVTSKSTDAPSEVLARVSESAIVPADLGTKAEAEPAERRRALERVIATRLAATEARRRGLDAEPPLSERIEAIRREARAEEEALLRDALFARIREKVELSEEELRAHYEETKGRYLERRLRLRRRVYASQAEAERAAEGANVQPTSDQELDPAPLVELPPSVLPEAARLAELGDGVLVEREGGIARVELLDVDSAAPRPFEQVRDEVERSLRLRRAQARFGEMLETLRAEAEVEIDEEALLAEPGGGEPPGAPPADSG